MQATNQDNALNIGARWTELLRYAAPNMLMMVLLSLYTIVDGMFIGQYLGSLALSSMNMVMPSFSLLIAVSLMLSIGGSAVCARLMGEGRDREARQTFSMLILVLLSFALLAVFVSLFYLDDLVRLLGCTERQLPLSMGYARYMCLFAPAFVLQTAFQTFFVTAGKPMWGLILTAVGGLLNVGLDYLFLAEMQLGIESAAVASGLAAGVTALGGLIYFLVVRRGSLCLVRPRFSFSLLGGICVNGSSEMVAHLSSGVTTWLLNIACLRYYGETGVAAITIILYLQFLFASFFFGYAEGVAPVTSYHYGAQNIARLKTVFRHNLRIISVVSLGVFAFAYFSFDGLLSFFIKEGEGSGVESLAQHAFSIYIYAFLLMALNTFASAHFTALGNGLISGLLAFTRTFACLSGSIILLPLLIGANGIWLSVPLAELLGFLLALYLLWHYRVRYQYY